MIEPDLGERLYVAMVQWTRERISQRVETMPMLFVGASEDQISHPIDPA